MGDRASFLDVISETENGDGSLYSLLCSKASVLLSYAISLIWSGNESRLCSVVLAFYKFQLMGCSSSLISIMTEKKANNFYVISNKPNEQIRKKCQTWKNDSERNADVVTPGSDSEVGERINGPGYL